MAITWDEFGTEITVPDTAENKSDDDAGTTTPTTSSDIPTAELQTVTITATRDQPASPVDKSKTVRKNPLSQYSSYTYNLALYMVTPDAYNKFEENNRQNMQQLLGASVGENSSMPSGGAYLICQSGGINNTSSSRAPGFDLDYYIDNLHIKSLIAPNSMGASTVTTQFTFQIVEPYGFSFLSNLKKAADSLTKFSKINNLPAQKNPTRQFYILGIQFKGYDKDGNGKIINASTDPNKQINESYFPIVMTKVNFKIDGNATTYNISAVSTGPNEALTMKRATIGKNVTLTASTVGEAIASLEEQLTQFQKDQKYEAGGAINSFKIEIHPEFTEFKNAVISLPFNNEKNHLPFAKVQNINEVTEAAAQNATPNPSKRNITLLTGSTVVQAIERIAVQSSFLINALKKVYDSEYGPDDKKKDYDSEPNNSPKQEIQWYNISTHVKCLGFNTKLNDYTWEIKYMLSPYKTPILLNPYSKNLQKYYGPVKRYEYWYTGKNSEVINYEQSNNNGYYIVVAKTDPNTSTSTGPAGVPVTPGQTQGGDQQGTKGVSQETPAAYLTDLYDPKSYSTAKISILGDPDFLMYDSLSNSSLTVLNQFYDYQNTRINPISGQVFIEMNFKEAIDYNLKKGVLDINDQITFWQYPQKVKKIVQGVSFMVTAVDHHFQNGKFTQDLNCKINTFSGEDDKWSNDQTGSSESQRDENESPAETARLNRQAAGANNSPNPDGTGTTTNTGLKEEPQAASQDSSTETNNSAGTPDPDNPGTTVASYEDGRQGPGEA